MIAYRKRLALRAIGLANSALLPLGLHLWGKAVGPIRGRYSEALELPPGARDELIDGNPRLRELRRRYADVPLAMGEHSVWAEDGRRLDIDLARFRGDNALVWQLRYIRRRREERYRAYADYVRTRDRRGLFDRLGEDGQFGCWMFRDSRDAGVSRDLIDSVGELLFLDREWGLFDRGSFTVVDVGAGYGRLAHRMAASVPGLRHYYCVDAVPESTFLCEFYLRFRGVTGKATAVPLDELPQSFPEAPDLAVNIHSFSEMPVGTIAAWVSWLAKARVQGLFLVSNEADRFLSLEPDGSRADAMPVLGQYGYRLVKREPVLADAALRRSLGITDCFQLFALGRRRPRLERQHVHR